MHGTRSVTAKRAPIWFGYAWPIAVGILFAAFVAFGSGTASHTDVAPVVTASAFVYLTSAALQRRTAAWPMFFVSVIAITIGFSVPDINPAWSSWAMLCMAVILLVYSVIRGVVLRPPWGVPLQAAGMAVFAAAAISAVHIEAMWAGLLVGASLLAHTAWDIYHHRNDRVVARSMALFCAVLDTFLAIVVLWVNLG